MGSTTFRYRALSGSEEIIVCNLSSSEINHIQEVDYASGIVNGARCGRLVTAELTIYGFTKDRDLIKSSKLFKARMSVVADTVAETQKSVNQYKDQLNRNTNRLLHNLTSLNGRNIQEIHSIVPQDQLSGQMKGHIQLVESFLKKNVRQAAVSTLRVAKNNAAIKAEISVFNKLFVKNPTLRKQKHNVHKVLMNVYYMFFTDLRDKSIDVTVVCDGELNAFFDYESMQVALYHLLENAVKYTLPNSAMEIKITKSAERILLEMIMMSCKIYADERELVFDEGYSGKIPVQLATSGTGLGLNRSKEILRLNESDLFINSDTSIGRLEMGVPYEQNTFTISLPEFKKRAKNRTN